MLRGILKKKLSIKTKIKIGIALILLIVIGILGAFFFFEDTLYNTVLKEEKTSDDVGVKGRPIYDATQKPSAEISDAPQVSVEDMLNGGFTASEAQVLAALEQILGSSSEEALAKYFGWNTQVKIKSLAPLIVPAICEEMKFGVNGDLSITQGIHELGWNYKAGGVNKRTSPAWKYHNAHGIKVGGSKPNEYWDGASENVSTHEYYGGGGPTTIRDDFKAFKSFWHAFMYHGDMLTNSKRYKPGNFADAEDCTDYAVALKKLGYYTDSSANYAKAMNSIYKSANMHKYRELYNKILEIIARNGGVSFSPNGMPIPEGEWKPGGKQDWGYFIDPSKGVITSENKGRVHPVTGKWFSPNGMPIPEGEWKPGGKQDWGYFIDPSKGVITSENKGRVHPVTGKWQDGHYAWDYSAPKGTPVYAVKSGTIIKPTFGYGGGYGNSVVVDHGDGYYTRYAHFSRHAVKEGDKVEQGDIIGYVGSTGRSTGNHLHFEIMKGGTNKKRNFVDHALYYNGKKGGKYTLKSSNISFSEYMKRVKNGGYNGGSSYSNSGGSNSSGKGPRTVGNKTIRERQITNNYTKKGDREIKFIVIHDTGNTSIGANALAHYSYFQTNVRGASAHYVVDENNIVRFVNDNDVAHHAGDRKRPGLGRTDITNGNSIGIEMAVNVDGNFDKTMQNTIELTRTLMEKYKIPLSNVVRHYDVSGKNCPAKLNAMPNGWNNFKSKLANTKVPGTSSSSSSSSSNSNDKYRGLAWAKQHDVNLSGLTKKRLSILEEGTKQLGKPYVYGANGPASDKYRGLAWAKQHDVNLSGLTKKRLSILEEGTKQLGKPYVYGANGPASFDCSGFTSWVYRHGPGIEIPRTSGAQQSHSAFVNIPIDKAKPGDLFGRPGHVGLFLKDINSKYFLAMHAPRSGDVVKVAKYPKYDRGQVKFYRIK